jgi:hypothetical protein
MLLTAPKGRTRYAGGRMLETGTSGLISGDEKRGVASASAPAHVMIGPNAAPQLVISEDFEHGFAGRFSLKDLETERRGPMMIKERVRNIGGELTIESVPGRGARLEISIPSPKAQEAYAKQQ